MKFAFALLTVSTLFVQNAIAATCSASQSTDSGDVNLLLASSATGTQYKDSRIEITTTDIGQDQVVAIKDLLSKTAVQSIALPGIQLEYKAADGTLFSILCR